MCQGNTHTQVCGEENIDGAGREIWAASKAEFVLIT